MTTIARGAEGQMSFDGRSVTITRRGLLPMLFHGSGGTKTISLASITAVQHRRCGFYAGYLQLSITGEADGSNAGGLNRSISKDENTVVFYLVAQTAFAELAAELRNAIAERNFPGTAAGPASAGAQQGATPNVFEQLTELGALRDRGFITPEDFVTKKNELLARI
jgi:hypothetical protein